MAWEWDAERGAPNPFDLFHNRECVGLGMGRGASGRVERVERARRVARLECA